MAAHNICFPCQQLDDNSDCQGCVLGVYFTTEKQIEDLKGLVTIVGKEGLIDGLEKVYRYGGNPAVLIGQISLVFPRFSSLKRDVTNQVGELRNAIDELTNQVVELKGRLDVMSSAFGRLVLRDSDDDSLTHVSNTQQSPDSVARMIVSPSGSPDNVDRVCESPPATVGHVSKSSPDNDSYVSETPPDKKDV